MKVYLDDLRKPPRGWTLVKTAKDAIYLLSNHNVKEISLDHDLGDDIKFGTGYNVLLWIEKMVYLKEYKPPIIHIHTANVSARTKMELCKKNIEKRLINVKRK